MKVDSLRLPHTLAEVRNDGIFYSPLQSPGLPSRRSQQNGLVRRDCFILRNDRIFFAPSPARSETTKSPVRSGGDIPVSKIPT